MHDAIVETMRRRFGDEWGRDFDASVRFSADAEQLLRDLDGAHLIGDAEIEDGEITLRMWVDQPLPDLMSADQLAYDIFARLSEELFYSERHFERKTVRYRFLTGTPRSGYSGSVVLAGPHAADFADRFHRRLTGGLGYQA